MIALRSRELGFTLIECVIATTVFAVGVATLGGMLSLALSRQSQAARQNQALDAAHELLAGAEASLALGQPPPLRGGDDARSWTVQISDVDAGLKRAMVSVQWREGESTRSLNLSRILLPTRPK